MWHPGCPRTGLATLTPAGFTGGKLRPNTAGRPPDGRTGLRRRPHPPPTPLSHQLPLHDRRGVRASPATRSRPCLTHPASGTAPLPPRGGRWPSAWRGDRLPDPLPVQAGVGQGEEVAQAVAGTVTRAVRSGQPGGSWPHGPSSLGAVGAVPAAAGHASWLVQGQ